MPMDTRGVAAAEVTGAQIRAAMLGSQVDGLRIERQAWRITADSSDELALLCVRDRSWWVARRLDDQLTVWACAGDDEAWDGFDRSMVGDGWREAAAAPATVAS